MTYRLPPLASMRAFEAAARHLSFKKAAEERQKALEVRKEINNRGAVARAAAGKAS